MRTHIFCLFFLLVAAACVQRGAGAGQSLLHDGIERTYLIEHPAQKGPAPTIVVLHGGGGRAAQIQRHAGFDLTRHGWVEIYPQGIDKSWNDGRTTVAGGSFRSGDDVGFLRALLQKLSKDGIVDPSRIYFTGPSNGGAMTQRMLCNAPDLVAGAAPVIMNFPIGLSCPPAPPKPVLFILGTEDPLVPYAGGPITLGRKDRGAVWPARKTYAFYARRNGCGSSVISDLPDLDPGDGMRSSKTTWIDCEAPLLTIDVQGGGHTWPGAKTRPIMERIVGRTTRDFSATAEIEAFFRAQAGQ